MGENWMTELRCRKGWDVNMAARAANVSVGLLETLESGGTTSPEIAQYVGIMYGMTAKQVREITCQATVDRRAREARMTLAERRRATVFEVYY